MVEITSSAANRIGNIVFAQINFRFSETVQPNQSLQVADMSAFGTTLIRGIGSYANGSAWITGVGIATVKPSESILSGVEQYAQFVFLVR